MKIVALGKKKIRLSEGGSKGWYGMTDKAREYMNKQGLTVGAEVTIETKDGKYGEFITKIGKGSGGQTSSSTTTSPTSNVNVFTDTPGGVEIAKYRDDSNVEVKENGQLKIYPISESAAKYGKAQIPEGSLVLIEIEDGKIVNIKKKTVVQNTTSGQLQGGLALPDRYSFPRLPLERAEMMSEAISHDVSATLSAMVGAVDPNNVNGLIDDLFKKYASKVTALAKYLVNNDFLYKETEEK